MDGSPAKLTKYRQMIGVAVAALILTVIFVPFQRAEAFTVDLDLPNVTDTNAVPTNANGATFEVTIDVEAGELISIDSIELILDNGEDTVKRAIFEKAPGGSAVYIRTSGDSTLTRGNLDVDPEGDTTGYGYGYGLVSYGTTFVPNYSYSFTYSNAFISGNSYGYSNAVGDLVTGIVGPGTITISGKLNTALMEDGVPHTLDVLINTGTGVNPDHIVAPQLTFTTTGNSNIKTEDVGTGDDVETEVDADGDNVKIKFSKVNGAGKLVVHKLGVVDLEDEYDDIFTSTSGGKGKFSFGSNSGTTLGDVFDIDASSVTIEDDGTYTVTIPYDEDDLPDGLSESDVRLFHYDEDSDEWEDITTDVDTAANTVTGETDSLSPIAAGYDDDDISTGGGGGGGGGGGSASRVVVNETFPPSYFETRPLSKVQISESGFTNMDGNTVVGGFVGQQISINASFRNFQETTQTYAIIIQVVDENDFTTDIGWTQGSLERGQGADASRSWTIEETGNYTIKIFVWDGVSAGPIPLSEVSQKNFSVN